MFFLEKNLSNLNRTFSSFLWFFAVQTDAHIFIWAFLAYVRLLWVKRILSEWMPIDGATQQQSLINEHSSHVIAWTQPGPSKQAPFPRSHHACCLTDKNELVLHGGWTGVKLVFVFDHVSLCCVNCWAFLFDPAELYVEIRLHLRNMVREIYEIKKLPLMTSI